MAVKRNRDAVEFEVAAHQYLKERDYWLTNLSGELVKSTIAYDFKKTPKETAENHVQFKFTNDTFSKLMTLSNGVDDVLHMALAAALVLLLNKYTGSSDIIIGSPIYKQDQEAEFINTVLTLRNHVESHMTFKDLLVQVRQTIIRAVEHQNYPIEILLEQLNLPVSESAADFPLFGAAVLLRNIHDKRYLEHIRLPLVFSFLRTGKDDAIEGAVEYNTSLYRQETIERAVIHFTRLIGTVLSHLDMPVSGLDILAEEEKKQLLVDFNNTKTGYPGDKTIPQLFSEQVRKNPHHVALGFKDRCVTYQELDQRANRLANYLYLESKIRPNDRVGLLMERSLDLIVSILGILKSSGAYVPMDTSFPEERLKITIDDSEPGVLISMKKYIRTLNRLQWECPSFHTFICLDSEDIYSEREEEKSELMEKKLWEYVGETASDEITGGGWLSSFTGEPIPAEEMAEYGDNILKKLNPLLHNKMNVLEIGCASGISMFRLAPKAELYYGTDLSAVIIKKNEERVKKEGHKNIILSCLPAHDIDRIPGENFDLVIINSVIQCFHGHNYLRNVIRKAIDKMGDKGWLFIGDVMNQDLQGNLIRDLENFKQAHRDNRNREKTYNYKTKTDWSTELFISPSFFEDLKLDMPQIRELEFSKKIYTIENELTKFRYDTLIFINKKEPAPAREKTGTRHKHQHDSRMLQKYGTQPVNPGLTPGDLAYIIYTSGSTGKPKGTLTRHFNVLRTVRDTNYIDLTGSDRVLQLSNYAFDGSVFDIFGALLNGSRLVMLNQQDVLAVDRLSDLIKREQITVFFVTTALFNTLTDIDITCLKRVRKVLFGGERVSVEHVVKALKYSGNDKIIHVYGPTETTVYATYYFINAVEKGQLTIPIGKPLANTTAYIFDKALRPVPIGAPGELFIGGDGVAAGYLNQPGLTAEKFCLRALGEGGLSGPGGPYALVSAHASNDGKTNARRAIKSFDQTFSKVWPPAGPPEAIPTPIYKTGDLARWLADGNIEFIGRIDTQVKIRGFRIELEEIENHLLKHPDIRETTVTARKDAGGDNYLCAYVVPYIPTHTAPGTSGAFSVSELGDYLSRKLPGFMVPSYFVELTAVPLTPNGKIDRKALPEPLDYKIAAAGYIAPENRLQEQLTDIWAEVLNIDKNCISIDANFFEIGGHSLKATVLMSKIHKDMNVKVSLAQIFKTPTIRGLSRHIPGTERENFISIEPVEKKNYYELSPAQKRLYILQQMEAVYNMNAAWVLKGVLEKKRLEETFNQLIRRHESLRTSFQTIDEEPVQEIHEEVDFEIEYFTHETHEKHERGHQSKVFGGPGTFFQKGSWPPEALIKNFIRPFDLSCAPLLRIGLIKIDRKKHILMLDMHHIISDGISLGIFIKEFTALYEGRELPGLRLQYKDYSEWLKRESQREIIKKQEEYWLKQFDTPVPVLELPVDYPRPGFQDFEGRTLCFEIGKAGTGALKNLANNEDATLYMVLLASLDVLLAKLSGNEDIAVGTPIASRRHMDLQPIIGMFVGTLVMRNYPHPLKTAAQFIQEVKERTLAAFENQDYPFENLVEKVVVNRDTGRNPLFDVMFAVQNIDLPGFEIEGLKPEPYDYESGVANFDLLLQVFEKEEILSFSLNYCTKLFKEETIKRFITYFKKILSFLSENPQNPAKKISEIEIMPEVEKRKILYDFNNTRTDYPEDKTIHGLFEEQAERIPNRIALVGGKEEGGKGRRVEGKKGMHLSYGELDERANQLAYVLKKKGVKPGTIVGIMVERSINMMVGLLGILKAGGAYLPIDQGYPGERVNYMLEDSKVIILVKKSNNLRNFEIKDGIDTLSINDSIHKNSPKGSAFPIFPSSRPASLAYVLYTSGSTGKPKGVMVDHRSVVNLLFALHREYPLKGIGTCLLKTPVVFDVSVSELFGWYLGQGRLALLEKDGEKDPYMIPGVIERERVTHINFVPSMFQTFVEMLTPQDISKLSSLEYIFLAGEELLPQPVIKFRQFDTGIILENLYGPTEGTVYSSKYGLSAWEGPGSIPIGKPLPNTGLYILDKNGFLQPIGVTGELYIAGTGAARGYLNNPGLTAERFCLRRTRGAGTLLGGRFLKKLPPLSVKHPRKNFLLKVPGKRIYSHMSYMSHMSYIYKTGDLARWLADGNIEFLGRTDRQVKIRGFRIELGEIENRLLAHRDVKEAAVAVVETRAGDKSLAAYIVTVSPGSGAAAKMEELRAYLPGKLPGYMVPSFFIPLENLPLTASGKVDRKALPEPGAAVHSEGIYTPPRNRIEERLVDLWAEIIGIKKETIGIEADFFKLGGHSLGAVKLIARIHKEINTHIPMNILFKAPTIRGLAGYIKGAVKEVYISTAPVEKKEYYPLSSIQKRLFILDQVGDINTAYNLPHALIVEGEAGIDTQYFQQTFYLLIKRHESLRTSFALIDNELVQIVHETVDFCISCSEAGENEIHRLIDEFITPFDLNEAPLLRAKLVKLTGKKYLFLYDMHHIISDGTSLGIFLKDFMHLYNREELPGLGVQYKDFSERQNTSHERVRSILKQKEKYWLDRFRGEIPRFNIYTDYPRPSVQSFAGDQVQFTFKKELCREVHRLRKETDTTLYMVLLSFYNILLARYTGQEDIIIGTPTAGREQVDIENVIGLFMNALPMRNYPRGNKTFKEFLAEVKQTTIEAYENQGYPFGDLVEKVAVIDDLSRNPIYEAELLVQNMEKPEWKLENLTVTPYEFVYPITQMDIALVVEESEGMIFFNLTYGTALFKRGTIEKMIDSFREIVSVVLDNPLIKLEDIKVSHHFSSLRSNVYRETPMDFEF